MFTASRWRKYSGDEWLQYVSQSEVDIFQALFIGGLLVGNEKSKAIEILFLLKNCGDE